MYDALKMATAVGEQGGYQVFEIAPADLYPATVGRIQEAIAGGELPAELIDHNPADPRIAPAQGAMQYMAEAQAIPNRAWSLADVPRDQITKQADVALRAQALEMARRWFTRALQLAAGGPIGLHILKDEDYRL